MREIFDEIGKTAKDKKKQTPSISISATAAVYDNMCVLYVEPNP